jgi:hypothetical protein
MIGLLVFGRDHRFASVAAGSTLPQVVERGGIMRIGYWAILIALSAIPAVLAQTVDLHVAQTEAGTGFTGAPYSAKQTAVTLRTTTNGTRYTNTTNVLLYRDAAGRTREDTYGKTVSGSDFHFVTVLDPVAGLSLSWPVSDDPAKKFVTISTLPGVQKITDPVSSRFGLPPVTPPTAKAEPIPYACPGCTVMTEYFSARPINGINALGSRTTRTYKIGKKENGQDFIASSVNETWTSPDLRINVRSISDLPEYGKTTFDVTDIVSGPQDPALFQAPAGYQIRDRRGETRPTNGTGVNPKQTGDTGTQTNQPIASHAVANALSGTWVNVDSNARGVVKVTIDGLGIHPLGACHPNPCDWGIIEGKVFSSKVDPDDVTTMMGQKYTTFSETTLTMTLESDGRLRLDDFTQFNDHSERVDYHTVSYFRRELEAAQTTVVHTPPAKATIRSVPSHPHLAIWNADNLIPSAGYAVEGAPFQALIEETRTPIGSETTRRFVRVIRDGAGRQRYEQLINAECKGCKAVVTSATVIDLVGQRRIRIDPVTRTAISCPTSFTSHPIRVPASMPEAQKSSAPSLLKRFKGKGESQDTVGEPHVAGLQVTLASAIYKDSAGQTSSAQTPHTVNELWTSTLYRMPVKRVIEDPDYGHIDIEVVHFQSGEPKAQLFQIPQGYVVKTEADDVCGATRTNIEKPK